MSTGDALREFFRDGLHWDERSQPLTDDLSLIDSGAVDSMGILMLATFLEERFAIEVRDEEIVPENFGSLAALTAYVERKRTGRT